MNSKWISSETDEQQKHTAMMNAAKADVDRTWVRTGLERPEQK